MTAPRLRLRHCAAFPAWCQRGLICFALLCALASAAAPDAVLLAQTTRDSAGITIVDNPTPAWRPGAEWRVDTTPALRVELASGPANDRRSFARVTGAVRFSDGRIAVANGRTFQVQVFDPTGRAVASFGRQGDGPGEFAELRYICRMRGDTLIASDGGRTHVVFAPDGSYVREVQPDLAPTRTVRQMAELQGCSPDGSFLLMRDGFVRNNTRTTRWDDSSFAYLYNPDGRLRASIGPLAGMTWDHAAGLQQPVMFGAMERHTFDGRYLYSAPATDFSIQLYDLNGRLARIVRRPWTPLTVTAGEIRTYKEYRREAFSGYSPDERREYEQMIEVLEIAPSHPAVQLLLVDARGNLWVREGAPWSRVDTARFRRGGRWSVFDPTGRWLGSVQIPDTITIVSIDSDVIIGTVVDAMGLEYLVTHRLIRP